MKRPLLILVLAIVISIDVPGLTSAAAQQRCFSNENPTISSCISEPFKSFWEKNGGLAAFGYPLGKVMRVTTSVGKLEVQEFERARLERHPENRPPYDVELAVLGEELLHQQGRDWQASGPAQSKPGCIFFAETGHTLCDPFLSYFRSHGLQLDNQRSSFSPAENLALFGMPLTEPAMERGTDGKQFLTQWFQRTRIELHPENPPADQLILGRLGAEAHSLAAQTPPTQAAKPTCQPIPAAHNIIATTTCLSDDDKYQTVFSLTGYDSDERISAWLIDADGITISNQGRSSCTLPDTIISLANEVRCRDWQLDGYGNASGVELDASALYPGFWTLVFQSKTTRANSELFFQVLPQSAASGASCAAIPSSIKSVVLPACGQAGALVKMIGQGFEPGERVSFFMTAPDSIVEPIDNVFYKPTQADALGNVPFVGMLPHNALKGDYFITIAGVTNDHKAIGAIRKR